MTALDEARNLPPEVEEHVNEIAEAALQTAFKVIADKLEELGYPVSGDFAPWEVAELDGNFRRYVRSMALNNEVLGAREEAFNG